MSFLVFPYIQKTGQVPLKSHAVSVFCVPRWYPALRTLPSPRSRPEFLHPKAILPLEPSEATSLEPSEGNISRTIRGDISRIIQGIIIRPIRENYHPSTSAHPPQGFPTPPNPCPSAKSHIPTTSPPLLKNNASQSSSSQKTSSPLVPSKNLLPYSANPALADPWPHSQNTKKVSPIFAKSSQRCN